MGITIVPTEHYLQFTNKLVEFLSEQQISFLGIEKPTSVNEHIRKFVDGKITYPKFKANVEPSNMYEPQIRPLYKFIRDYRKSNPTLKVFGYEDELAFNSYSYIEREFLKLEKSLAFSANPDIHDMSYVLEAHIALLTRRDELSFENIKNLQLNQGNTTLLPGLWHYKLMKQLKERNSHVILIDQNLTADPLDEFYFNRLRGLEFNETELKSDISRIIKFVKTMYLHASKLSTKDLDQFWFEYRYKPEYMKEFEFKPLSELLKDLL